MGNNILFLRKSALY